jgi:hypothetical protein
VSRGGARAEAPVSPGDPLVELAGFGRALRGAGVPVGLEQLAAFGRALALLPRVDRAAAHLAARATLAIRREELPLLDEAFARWFGGGAAAARPASLPHAPRHDRAFHRTALHSYLAEAAAAGDREAPLPDEAPAASAHERLARKDFAKLGEAERAAVARQLRELRLAVALRRSPRRERVRRGGELDLAAALRLAGRRGGAVLSLPRRRPRWKRRPLVVLVDLSGSMELYARLLLVFLHAVRRRHGAVEIFAFGTRLTHITGELALRDLDAALASAADKVVDFGGGTRIGECLRAFHRRHAARVCRRGAVALLVSDGLDTGEPAELARQVARLRARCHRLIWLNPLLGSAGYRPLAAGMAAALPHVDDFLPVRDLRSLEALARHLEQLPRRPRPDSGRFGRDGAMR